MSKGLAKAAQIIAVVVAVAAAIPTGGGSTLLAGALGVSAASASAIAAGVGLAASAVGAIAAKNANQPAVSISGNQSQFTASLDQGLPWLIGRTRSAGCAVHDITYDAAGTSSNDYQTFFGVWSADRCNALVHTEIDNVEVDFALSPVTPTVPDEAVGSYHDWMWHRYRLGAPGDDALSATGYQLYPPGWSSSSGLSAMSCFAWTLKFDHKGEIYPGGTVPQKRDTLEGALAYDPRLDDTYPGGSGPQRANDESTWTFTENPYLLGLKWARGIWANGRKKMGIGWALAAISLPSVAEAANVADANGWKVGGVVYSTDPKWDVLKKICAAGSGEPIRVGGILHFLVDAPKVSLDTITTDDLIAKPTIPSGARMKDRINGVIPTFRSPSNDWQLVPATKVTVPAYVTEDGRPRTKAITWELVQDADQVATLAAYAICNAREIDGIVLPCKVRWIGYRPGDAVTVASSVTAMDSQLVVLRNRSLEPSSAAVTFTARTETTSKHAFALGQTTTPPPTPALATTNRDGLLNPGVDAAWSRTRNDDGNRPEDGATRTTPKGPWLSSVSYVTGDIVTYDGSSYIARQNAPAGTPITDATYWQQFAMGGVQGAPGRDGTNGTSAYFFLAYSDSPDGSSNFSTVPGSRRFIGTYVSTADTAPSSYTFYTWSKLTGDNGVNGTNGTPGPIGPDGRQSFVHFAYADSSGGGSNFTTGDPGSRTWIGVYSDYTLADSNNPGDYAWSLIKGSDGSPGVPGRDGTNGSSAYFFLAYADSSDGSSNFSYLAGSRRFIGTYVSATNAAPTSYTAYTWSKLTGDNGVNGTNGTPGPIGPDGRQSFVHFAYADSAGGGSNFTTGDPGSRTWIGVYSDYALADSNNPGDYAWSLIKGSDGSPGTPGANGANGSNGAPGAPGPPGPQGPAGTSPAPALPSMGVDLGTRTYPDPVTLSNGQSIALNALIAAGGLTGSSAAITIEIQVAPSGSGSWSVVASATDGYETGDQIFSATGTSFTNTSGGLRAYDVRVVVTKSGSGNPGAVDHSQSILTLGL